MLRHPAHAFAVLVCLALACANLNADPPRAAADDAGLLAARIDQLIAAGWAARNVTPAPQADDAEFLRRVSLDIGGRIPRVGEVHAFLADPSPDKRRRLVERLLAGPHYVQHFTNVWRARLLPQSNNPQVQFLAQQLEAWARWRLRENLPYDQMVRDLVAAPLTLNQLGRPQPGPADPTGMAFFQANELKPENLAAATSRLFLGVKLECAQCHDHPFATWSRKQFWEFAAFFAGIRPLQPQAGAFSPVREEAERHEIQIPNTEKVVRARFLDGKEPAWTPETGGRERLAEWMTRPDNPYFARAAANRLWAHFFGVGLIDPVDELGANTPPSHPELFDELARSFAAHGFDVKFLIRAITASRTYQLRSDRTHPSQEDLRAFGRMPLKGLTPEQFFDSLATATGYRENQAPGMRPPGLPGTPRAEFLARFAGGGDRRTEQQTSILQALALMNGGFIADATSLDRSETLAAIVDAPFLDDRQRLEALYLAALSRPLKAHEASRLVPYVARGGAGGDRRQALADVFWALLNSSEFFLNH
jgi:hypothetical protein